MTTGLPGGRPADLYVGIGDPGVPYAPMWAWQVARARAVAAREAPEAIVLVEHAPVYTLGRAADPANLLRDEGSYRASGAEVHWIDRGGDATWHGPGQVTGYPILDLTRDPVRPRDIHRHVWNLEACLIDVAASYGIVAERAPDRPGIWVGDAKLAAIGIKVTRWVTFHGFGLNVSPDLAWFEGIVPCGLHGFGVTSLAMLLGSAPPVREVSDRLAVALGTRFGIAPGPEMAVPRHW